MSHVQKKKSFSVAAHTHTHTLVTLQGESMFQNIPDKSPLPACGTSALVVGEHAEVILQCLEGCVVHDVPLSAKLRSKNQHGCANCCVCVCFRFRYPFCKRKEHHHFANTPLTHIRNPLVRSSWQSSEFSFCRLIDLKNCLLILCVLGL